MTVRDRSFDSVKIQAKVLCQSVQDVVPDIASFYNSPVPLLRERAVNALGRIGRGDYRLIEPFWEDLFRFASDEDPKVRLSFIWASENIATNTPDIYENYMSVFAGLLDDTDDKVRMEAPEIFPGRSLSDRIWNSCSGWLKQTKTAS